MGWRPSVSKSLFADDGILIEPDLAGRLDQSASTWKKGCVLAICEDALNKDKIRVEGLRSSAHIVLGY